MIRYAQGNLLEVDVEAVVNTVNTFGIVGKGTVLMFKERFPGNFEAYSRTCEANEVRIGKTSWKARSCSGLAGSSIFRPKRTGVPRRRSSGLRKICRILSVSFVRRIFARSPFRRYDAETVVWIGMTYAASLRRL